MTKKNKNLTRFYTIGVNLRKIPQANTPHLPSESRKARRTQRTRNEEIVFPTAPSPTKGNIEVSVAFSACSACSALSAIQTISVILTTRESTE